MDQEPEDYADRDLPPPAVDSPAALVELIWQLIALGGLGFLIVGAVILIGIPLWRMLLRP